MRDSLPAGNVGNLYATLWRHAEGRRGKVVLFVVLLVVAQVVRLTIPWYFGEAVNALQARGMEGIAEARNDLLLMLAAVGVAWTMHGPARIVERFTALVIRERFADALHAMVSDAEALAAAAETERAAKVTLDLTHERMQDGYTDYLTELAAGTAYSQAVLNLVQAQAARFGDTAALYQALGGGWWNRKAALISTGSGDTASHGAAAD